MRVQFLSACVTACVVLAGVADAQPGGGSSGGGGYSAPQREITPEDRAQAAFRQGVRAVKQADKQAKAAAEAASEAKQAKAQERARRDYEKAREAFTATVQQAPQNHDAWNYLGYTSRKLGHYNDSLAAYDEALRLKADFAEAIEYRAETYLALDRLEDAKGEYMKLFRDARPMADQLMAAMRQWIAQRRSNPGDLGAADIEAFAQWVEERAQVAQQTASLAVTAAQSAWKE
jgi:tetratricopeptide (TPR) repeat protein